MTQVDDSKACYTKFLRVTGTPEEIIIDFGLNADPLRTHYADRHRGADHLQLLHGQTDAGRFEHDGATP